MRRVVISTGSGQYITEADVEEQALVATVAAWLQVLPDAGIYLDGQLLSDEARVAMLTALAASATPAPVEALPEPTRIKEYSETLKQAFADLRMGHVQSLRDLQDCARRYSEMWLERERQFADEAARQRGLTSRSLADVDLLDRSVKAARLQEMLATAGSNSAARVHRGPSVSAMDLLGGLLRAVAGQK
jgi:hypothetical protein